MTFIHSQAHYEFALKIFMWPVYLYIVARKFRIVSNIGQITATVHFQIVHLI